MVMDVRVIKRMIHRYVLNIAVIPLGTWAQLLNIAVIARIPQ